MRGTDASFDTSATFIKETFRLETSQKTDSFDVNEHSSSQMSSFQAAPCGNSSIGKNMQKVQGQVDASGKEAINEKIKHV